MFCTKCGAQMPDTAQFCPNCGTVNRHAQGEGGAQQSAPVNQPAAAPAQNTWQAQPQNWQQPQQTAWQQGGAYAAGQAMPYGAPVKKARKFPVAIVAAVAVVVVGVFAAAKFTPLRGTFLRSFAAPEKYYAYVEQDSMEELAETISSTYDNLVVSNVASDDQSVSGNLTIQLGDEARKLLVDALGEALDEVNEGDDLSWLKSLSVAYGVNRKGDMGSVDGKLRLNGTDILSLDGVLAIESGKIWISIPELSDRYLETSLEELDLDDMDIDLGSLLSAVTSMDPTSLDPVLQALPEGDVMEKLLKKYLDATVACIDKVEKKNGTLSIADVSAEYTVMVTTIDGETVQRIVREIGPQLKEDKDLRDIIIDMAEAMEEDGQQTYDEFIDMIDEMLENADDIPENMDEDIIMTVYADASGDVHGRTVEVGEDMRIELLMPEKSGKFGLRLCVHADGEDQILLLGSGKRNGSKLTGTMDLEVEGTYFGTVGLDGFDDEEIKEGYLVGAITFSPSSELWNELDDIPSSVVSILEDVELRLDMNTSKNKSELTLSATTGGKLLLSVAFDSATAGGKSVKSVTGVEPEEWSEDITLDKLERVVESIEKAGVPQAYTDLLDEALDSAF